MNELLTELVISIHQPVNPDNVAPDELRLISNFFPEILKEMLQHLEDDEE